MKSRYAIRRATGFGISLLISFTQLLGGCGSGYSGGDYALGTPPPGTVASITITPPSVKLTSGTIAKLTAVGHYADGTIADISGSVSWSSAAPATASVVTPGLVTGNAVGTTTVTASMNSGSVYGNLSASDTVTVTAATLTNIAITPPTTSIAKGTATTFTANGTFSDATTGNVSGSVSWSSSDAAVATVNASGLATGVGIGTCTIAASAVGISNIASLTVF